VPKLEKNVGNLDAFSRLLFEGFLVYFGLVVLEGIKVNMAGIIVALISLMPFYMVITRKCFVSKFLNISSIPKKKF
jgi:Inner membrane protein YgaP-like, transmembrane domain